MECGTQLIELDPLGLLGVAAGFLDFTNQIRVHPNTS
jgi:hypothetical protein